MEITQKLIKELFDYHDGFLYWKISLSNRIKIGDKAGSLNISKTSGSRYRISIKQKYYACSRLIFLFHTGYLPTMVDHIDRDTTNDKIENLRAADRSQNQRNRTPNKNCSSKYLGVSRCSNSDRWIALIFINKKLKYLGCFKKEIDAAKAYNEAAKIHFGEFANLNIIK